MFIAIDDTDSRKGMCTTFLATELIKEFQDYDLLDYPRLVRLNPNIPWKTRGNGAVVLTLGKGKKRKQTIGKIGQDVSLFDGDHIKRKEAFYRVKKVVEKWSECDKEGTNPGFVISEKRPPRRFYEKAVKKVVELEEILDFLDKDNHAYKGYGKKRGLIGATSALAWKPEDFSYELLTYRKKEEWGTPRDLFEEDVKKFERKSQRTFDNYDHEEESQTIAPKSPCPVLYGVRGENPKELKKALNIIGGENPKRWVTFLTNQATDDHIQEATIPEIEPWTSVRTEGEVSSEPYYIKGGHVLFDVRDKKKGKENNITAAAYEPTKDFRKVIEKLVEGDRVELWGGIRKEPLTLNIEKIKILELKEKTVKVSNPVCPECRKTMSSIGRDAGYRCKKCSTRADESDIKRKKVGRELTEGCWYEPPVSARRHLSKPLSRDSTHRSTSRRSS